MRRIDTQIPDEVSREVKQKVKQGSIEDPNKLVFAMSADSWTKDGRENIPLSVTLVRSLLQAFTTDNSIADSNGERCKGGVTDSGKKGSFKKGDAGDPIVWGTLDVVICSVMGTDAEPLLVVGASGRQKVKHTEYLTALCRFCRKVLCEELKKLKDDEKKARQNAVNRVRIEGEAWEQKWLDEQDVDFAAECRAAEMNVINELTDAHWDIIFKHGNAKLGRPLVGPDYSAVFWVKVAYDEEAKPTNYGALERAKLANQRLASPILTEADSARRMIEHRVMAMGQIESQAIEAVRDFVTNPIAVGPANSTSYEFVEQLYRVSQTCEAIRAKMSAERDPIKALLLLKRIARKCFKAEVDADTGLSRNKLTEDEQLEALAVKTRRVNPDKDPSKTTVPTTVDHSRFASLARSPMSGLSEQQRLIAKAVAAGVRCAAGDETALDDFPFLKVSSTDKEVLEEALDAVDHWNGKGLPVVREEKEDDEADSRLLSAAQKLIDEGLKTCPSTEKNKAAWLAEWLREKK